MSLAQDQTMHDILRRSKQDVRRQLKLVMKTESDDARFLELHYNNMTVNGEDYITATFHDCTEVVRLEKVESNNRLLNMLTSSVTHELMTPLKCISSFARSLQKELQHSAKRQEAELIDVTSKLMISHVSLLLDKSMIENKVFKPNIALYPFNKIVSDAVQIMRQIAQIKKITIEYIPLLKELIVSMDSARTQQVLINLLSNAIKFSHEGS